jgi:hypothetical protein
MPRISVSFCARALLASLAGMMVLLVASMPAHAITKRPPQAPKAEAAEEPAPEAAPEEKAKKAVSPEREQAIREVFDREFRFSKKFQSELGFFGGSYLGDEWYNTWNIGGRYYLHLNNSIAFGTEYLYSPIRADASGDFGKSLTTNNMHTLTGAMMYSNGTAFRAGDSVVECDLILTVGGGAMQINRQWEPVALIGGGLKVYLPIPWFAIRFDVNTYLHPTPKPGGNSFNSDMLVNLGFSFLFPTKEIAPKTVSAQSPQIAE